MGWRLRAQLDGHVEVVDLDADNEIDATTQGAFVIAARAATSALWANGRVDLLDPDGRVVETMDPHPS